MTTSLRFLRRLAIFSSFALTLVCSFSCLRQQGGYHYLRGTTWNTLYSITYRSSGSSDALEDSVHATLEQVGRSLSVFDSTSLVSRVNRQPVTEVDRHFRNIYALSKEINVLSGGLFDPTAEPLIRAWGFGQGHRPDADTLRIDSILNFVGLNRTELRGTRLIKQDPRTGFNFSALAKGYGCDELARMFRRNGVSDYMIEIGGEVAVGGKSPRGGDWQIAVEGPRALGIEGPEQAAIPGMENYSSVVALKEGGIATSSNLRNFQDLHGTRVGHVISPLTGRPITTDILSATVIAGSCARADALATASLTLGSAKAPQMLRRADVKALLITPDSVIAINW